MPPCHSCTHIFRYTHISIFMTYKLQSYTHIFHIYKYMYTFVCIQFISFLFVINKHTKIHVNLNEAQHQLTCYMSIGPRSQLFEPCRSWRVAGSVKYSQSFAVPIPMPVTFASHHGRQDPGWIQHGEVILFVKVDVIASFDQCQTMCHVN